jgi:hypothetical protein
MSTAPALSRIAGTVKEIGELHLKLATQIERSGTGAPLASTSARSELVELVRSVLVEFGVLSPLPYPSPLSTPAPTTPAPTTPPNPTDDDEEPMSIRRPDFGYAHARFAMKDDEIIVERATGFERVAFSATKPPEYHCDPDSAPLSRPEPLALPRNTRLVRLRLSADHQIDPSEVVAVAVPADRDTAYRYEVTAIPVDDRTVDVAVRTVDPDINAPVTVARVHVLLFRVA